MTYKYIKFTGDYSKLKSMGYEFCRLFADNYMQWCNKDTRVWKKGSDVTHDRLTNFEGSFFELYMSYKTNNQFVPFHLYTYGPPMLRVIKNRVDETVSFDYDTYMQQTLALMDDPDLPYNLECAVLTAEDLKPLDTLIELEWVELGERK